MSVDLPDRRVHAEHPDGRRLVRHERAGKWKLERPDGTTQALALGQAVVVAAGTGWTVHYGVPGGGMLDERVRQLVARRERLESWL